MSQPNTDNSTSSNAKTNLTQSIQAALTQLENAYSPSDVEAGMYQGWEDSGYFAPTFDKDESFSIALPPPNVTGSLHMGHGFNNAIMDALTRYRLLCPLDEHDWCYPRARYRVGHPEQ